LREVMFARKASDRRNRARASRRVEVLLGRRVVSFATAYLLIRLGVGAGDGLCDLPAFVVGQAPGEHAEQFGVPGGHPAAADLVVG